jgi:hypothetical protein
LRLDAVERAKIDVKSNDIQQDMTNAEILACAGGSVAAPAVSIMSGYVLAYVLVKCCKNDKTEELPSRHLVQESKHQRNIEDIDASRRDMGISDEQLINTSNPYF